MKDLDKAYDALRGAQKLGHPLGIGRSSNWRTATWTAPAS